MDADEEPTQRRDVLPGRRPRGPVLLTAGAAAVIVAAIALGATLLARSGPTGAGEGTAQNTPPPSISTPPPSTSTAPTDDPHEQTDALLTQLLAGVPPLPGATPSDAPPDPALEEPPESSESPNVLEHDTFWAAAGSVDAALQFYRAHPPDDLTLSGTSSGSNTRTGETGPESLIFGSPDTDFARETEVIVSVIATDGGVAVGAYAQAVWIPVRDPVTLLADVSSVDVTVTRAQAPGRPGAPTVTRTVTGADAQTLADVVNALPVPTPGVVNCPAMFAGITDELDFATTAGAVRVTEDLTGCGGVEMTLPDGTRHGLAAGGLNATLMQILGLPENYGYG